jgi:hypothetical protein
MRYNATAFRKSVFAGINQNKDKYTTAIFSRARVEVEREKAILLKGYDKDAFIQEIAQGPDIGDGKVLGYGNLFSFIGFYNGDTPTDDFRDFLKESIYVAKAIPPKFDQPAGKIRYYFGVFGPNKKEIRDNSPVADKWTEYGWVELLEEHLNNFDFYLNRERIIPSSRSDHGIQVEHANLGHGGSFAPRPFLTNLLKELQYRLKFGANNK